MAAGLGFKDFVTGEVLTAADVDGYLMQGIWVFDDAAARDAAVTSPQEGNACYLKDTDEVLTYDGSVWVAVGGGGGGGKVLQVVQATTTTEVSVTTASFTDSGLTASITPTLNTSKIMVLTTQNINLNQSDETGIMAGGIRILRGATTIFTPYEGSGISFYESDFFRGIVSMHYLDSPATTSSTTYKTQIYLSITGGGASIAAQPGSCQSSIILMEIGA